jgi:hypothetical protein
MEGLGSVDGVRTLFALDSLSLKRASFVTPWWAHSMSCLRAWVYRTIGTQVAVLGILVLLSIVMFVVECGIVATCRRFGKCCFFFVVLLTNFGVLIAAYYNLVPPLILPLAD